MITVLCVLRSGGVYAPEWAIRLREAVARNLTLPHRFMCLSDVDVPGVEVIPLRNDWPRWWAKVEMLSPWVEELGRCLYIDLDTLVTGNIDAFAAYGGPACVTRDFNFGVPSQSVLNFAPGQLRHLWAAFTSDPEVWMADGDRLIPPHFGDQVLMTKCHGSRLIDFWQDKLPGQLVSFKRDCGNGLPVNARMVCLHGKPKQCDFPAGHWVKEHWRRAA